MARQKSTTKNEKTRDLPHFDQIRQETEAGTCTIARQHNRGFSNAYKTAEEKRARLFLYLKKRAQYTRFFPRWKKDFQCRGLPKYGPDLYIGKVGHPLPLKISWNRSVIELQEGFNLNRWQRGKQGQKASVHINKRKIRNQHPSEDFLIRPEEATVYTRRPDGPNTIKIIDLE